MYIYEHLRPYLLDICFECSRIEVGQIRAQQKLDINRVARLQPPIQLHTSDGLTLHAWLVEDGTTVEEGVTVAVLESMKMEVPVKAPRAGNLRQTTAASDTVTANGAIGFVEE